LPKIKPLEFNILFVPYLSALLRLPVLP